MPEDANVALIVDNELRGDSAVYLSTRRISRNALALELFFRWTYLIAHPVSRSQKPMAACIFQDFLASYRRLFLILQHCEPVPVLFNLR